MDFKTCIWTWNHCGILINLFLWDGFRKYREIYGKNLFNDRLLLLKTAFYGS